MCEAATHPAGHLLAEICQVTQIPVSSSELPTSRKMRSYWRESSGGL